MQAGIYARVSTGQQYGNYSYGDPLGRYGSPSYGYQVEHCLAKAQQDGYEVAPEHIVCEVVSGGYFEHQKELHRLLDLALDGHVAAIYCYMPDRLTRDAGARGLVLGQLARKGVEIIYVHDSFAKHRDELGAAFRLYAADHFRQHANGLISQDDIDAIAALMASS